MNKKGHNVLPGSFFLPQLIGLDQAAAAGFLQQQEKKEEAYLALLRFVIVSFHSVYPGQPNQGARLGHRHMLCSIYKQMIKLLHVKSLPLSLSLSLTIYTHTLRLLWMLKMGMSA